MERYLKYLFVVFVSIAGKVHAQPVVSESPDHKIKVQFSIDAAKQNKAFYAVTYSGRQLLKPSPLGFEFEQQQPLQANLQIVSVDRKLVDTSWQPVYGEKNKYRDHYNSTLIQLKETIAPFRIFEINFRVYNEGMAFQYSIPVTKSLSITKELTGFQFDKDYTSWVAPFAQAEYKKANISKTGKGCERPYVIEMDAHTYIALGEADLVDHARMKFNRAASDSLLLEAALDGKPAYENNFTTPWRYVMIAGSPGKLLENNFFILNLNAPCAISDVSWIKPGKVIREVTLTTSGSKTCIDFAAKHNIQYVEFDAGWYGPETNPTSDATKTILDTGRSKGPFDLQQIIAYANSKNIGIILYVNQTALSKQLDTILPLYQSWGIKGLKYGFVHVGSQQHTRWLHEAVRKAAKYKLMVDIHDEYRPTGYSRTYPNLLTQEGVRGNEEMPDGNNNTTLPFTRFIAGAADATVSYYHRRELKPWVAAKPNARMIENTCAHQLALAIINYSPFQFLYWYDRAEDVQDEPELELFDKVPTVWDDTKVLQGSIGEKIAIARRKENNWFVGCITNNDARKMKLRLDFLQPGENYELTTFTDGGAAVATRTHVKVERKKVNNKTKLDLDLLPRGGCAMMIRLLSKQ